MQMADHNANIPNEYEKLHVLPYNFKEVDDQEFIEDPLGMNGASFRSSSAYHYSTEIITEQS